MLYAELLTSGRPNNYLTDIDHEAAEMFSRPVCQIAEVEGITEKPKANDMMLWVDRTHNRSEYILNSFDVPYTNGFTEGCNNKTKVLKRVCFGVRNFDTFRNRILHCDPSY